MKKNRLPVTTLSTKNEDFLKLISEHVPSLIAYIDHNHCYVYTNSLYEEWFGFKKGEAIGKSVKKMRGIKSYKKIKPYLDSAFTGEKVSHETKIRKKDDGLMFATVEYVPYHDEKGKIVGVFSFIVDLSEIKKAEKLKESEKQLRRLVNGNIIGVIICSMDGPILEANDIFLNMVGYTREDLEAGKINWKKMTPTEYHFLSEKIENDLLTKGSSKPFEKEYIRKDGSRIPVLVGDVLLDEKSRRVIAFILDMTKQHELQRRKDEFIALASHELKTPITSLKLYAQIMSEYIKKYNDKRAMDLFLKMNKQINEVNELVGDLLDVSRLQSGKLTYTKTRFSIKRLVTETVQELQKVTHTHTLLFNATFDEKIKADRARIKQVLSNLITNAVKYSPQAAKVIISLKKKDNTIQIMIRDFGIGIDKIHQKQLFERYFQAENSNEFNRSGLGLGLFLSKEIILQHKGHIWQKSKPGGGSTFYFTLPF